MNNTHIYFGWFGFWIFLAVLFYTQHTQYMAGHETIFFTHKTDEEKRIREATIQKLESEAARAVQKAKLL